MAKLPKRTGNQNLKAKRSRSYERGRERKRLRREAQRSPYRLHRPPPLYRDGHTTAADVTQRPLTWERATQQLAHRTVTSTGLKFSAWLSRQ